MKRQVGGGGGNKSSKMKPKLNLLVKNVRKSSSLSKSVRENSQLGELFIEGRPTWKQSTDLFTLKYKQKYTYRIMVIFF